MEPERSASANEVEARVARGDHSGGEEATDADHRRLLARARHARVAKLVAAVLILIALSSVLQNAQPVEVRLLFATIHPRLIWVLLACAGVGGIVGYLIARPSRNARLHEKKRAGERRP